MNNKAFHQPLVSVILTTYNRAHIVSKSLQSVLTQTYRNFEAIVIDDNSTDNTKEIITNIACKDSRVKYFRNNENKGPAGARNVGINLAKGEFIAFADDDDEWFPNKLEKQVNLLQTLPENFAVVYSGFYKIIGTEKTYIPPKNIYPKEGSILSSLLKGNFVGTPSILVRKSALLDVGLFDEKLLMFEDWELVIRLSKKYQFKLIDEPLFISYDSPNSVNKQKGVIFAHTVEYILEKHFADFEKDKEALSNWYFEVGRHYILNNQKKLGLKYLKLALKNEPYNKSKKDALILEFLVQELSKNRTR
jgi:glycosyltransferase involved in cell wall biosynthesis